MVKEYKNYCFTYSCVGEFSKKQDIPSEINSKFPASQFLLGSLIFKNVHLLIYSCPSTDL